MSDQFRDILNGTAEPEPTQALRDLMSPTSHAEMGNFALMHPHVAGIASMTWRNSILPIILGLALVVLAMWLAILATAPKAHADEACVLPYSLTKVRALEAERNDPAQLTFTDYDTEQSKTLMDAINAIPPQSNIAAPQRLLAMVYKDTKMVHIEIVDHDCVSVAFMLPIKKWEQFVTAAFGEGA